MSAPDTPRLDWHCLPFAALSLTQLYALLRLRQEVFVLEQDCVYLDADGRDSDALHLFAQREDAVVACCRILAPGVNYAEPSIGRVCTAASQRGQGTGVALMQRAVACCEQHYPGQGIRISAQHYLKAFYEGFGFTRTSDVYDEDGIPHIQMLRS